jgi:hypothetical protein
MATRHLSLRIDSETFDELTARSREAGQTRSHLAKTLLEEGLRMQAHPGIVFRPGAAGRRPALADGPDVWMVARILRDVESRGEAALCETAELTGLHPSQVAKVARYYAQYQDEIDEWLRRLDEEADRAEAAWRREQTLLGA